MVSTVETSTTSVQSVDVLLQTGWAEASPGAPALLVRMSDVIVRLGEMAEFSCSFDGQPLTEIVWDHNGDMVVRTERRDKYTLVINDVRKELEGEYSCTASNRLGKSTCTSYLHVKVKDTKDVEEPVAQPPYFTKPIEPMQCTVGGNAVFEYRVTGVPLPSVQWLKDSCHIQPGKFCNMVNNVDGSGFLKIINVQKNDSGLYSCRASNLRGEASCSADLIVFLGTVSMSQMQFERQKTTYESSVYEQTTEQTSESSLFRGNLSAQTTAITANSCVLEALHESKKETSGKYSCEVSNAYGSDICHCQVTAQQNPPTFITTLTPTAVGEGERLSLSCNVTGSPPLNIQWMKDRREVTSSATTKITFTDGAASLVIDKASKTDAGDYLCKASNSAGSTFSKTKVTIKGTLWI
ncbi:titin-like [Astyanax mexicanus]|uniref:Titin-like n=1 Tax=Astyanax mexicanus TaxID=7994 RepID=A0A8T2LLS9_ASTMX|nr:titin-like [Astyanax mexicanus]